MKRKFEMLDNSDLASFVEKVKQLKSEGLSTTVIAERLEIHRNTLNERLRNFRKMSMPG
jgi:sugar diacid utilization regulator